MQVNSGRINDQGKSGEIRNESPHSFPIKKIAECGLCESQVDFI